MARPAAPAPLFPNVSVKVPVRPIAYSTAMTARRYSAPAEIAIMLLDAASMLFMTRYPTQMPVRRETIDALRATPPTTYPGDEKS